MLSLELLAIAAILIFQPLIALLWLYVAIRLTADYVVSRAEDAIDGRIEEVKDKIQQ